MTNDYVETYVLIRCWSAETSLDNTGGEILVFCTKVLTVEGIVWTDWTCEVIILVETSDMLLDWGTIVFCDEDNVDCTDELAVVSFDCSPNGKLEASSVMGEETISSSEGITSIRWISADDK